MKNNIYEIAFECKKIADQQIEVIRTIIPRGNIIYTDYTVNGNIRGYEQKLLCLKDAMKDKYPELCFQMQEHMDDVKDRMNEFICKVLEYFELPQIEMLKFSQWEADRDKFIKEVCNF